MNVHTVCKALLHIFVAAHVGEYAQLDLAVIRVEKHFSLFGNKKFPHIPPQLRADWNILDIRFRGGNTSRAGLSLFKKAVYPAVLRDYL